MVRDLIMNLKENDLVMVNKSTDTSPVFDVVWGNLFEEDDTIDALICNIIIPESYWQIAKYKDNSLTVRFHSPYTANTDTFRIRLVGLKDGQYSLFPNVRGKFGSPVSSYAMSKNISSPIPACMLPFVDIDGDFMVVMVQNSQLEELDKAYVYSDKQTDMVVDYSDDQAAQLLSKCAPGNSYRYPTTGVGITNYLNSVISHSDLEKVLSNQFSADNRPLQDASFDSETGELETVFSPEIEKSDEGLMSLDDLNSDFFSMFTDEFVRKNMVLNELTDLDYIKLLSEYTDFLEIVFFPDENTNIVRLVDKTEEGRFYGDGSIIRNDDYMIITSTLEANTIVMFDNELDEEIKDAPIFIVNDSDETRLYTALVGQPYWITDTCHKCFILTRRATVKYTIRKSQFAQGKGLYIIPQTSANIKNMLSLVQDVHTGRILGIVSNSTNISDITLEEITQYIYATKVNE